MTTCKNCGTAIDDKFCPHCGQKAAVHRFTIKHILHDFFHVFTHFDKGLPYLIKEMFIKPGVVVREYLEGKRNKYYNPFQFFLLSSAAVLFLTVKLDLGTLMVGDISVTGSGAEAFQKQFIPFMYQYFNVLQFVTVPVLSFYTYLMFRKSGYNYAEILVLNTFITAQRHLIFIVFAPLMFFFKASAPGISKLYITAMTTYYCWATAKFFLPKNKAWAIIKLLLISALFFITNAALLLAVFFLFFYKR